MRVSVSVSMRVRVTQWTAHQFLSNSRKQVAYNFEAASIVAAVAMSVVLGGMQPEERTCNSRLKCVGKSIEGSPKIKNHLIQIF